MNIGKSISVPEENPFIPGCTVSSREMSGKGWSAMHYALAAHTSISIEQYAYHRLYYVYAGTLIILNQEGKQKALNAGEFMICPVNHAYGMRTENGCVYLELSLREDMKMNDVLKAGTVLVLKDLVPYQKDKIVSMDLIDDSHMKYALMAFDSSTALSEHAAPGDAIVTALDGEGIIGYEGTEYVLKEGQSFRFAKNGRHYVRAEKPFKMSLLLTLD